MHDEIFHFEIFKNFMKIVKYFKTPFIYIFIHHQDGSTVEIRRINKIYNLTKKKRMKQSSPNAHAMRYTNRLA